MRTTLNIDDSLVREAARLTGVSEKTALVRMGLEALVARESARRLADLGGTERKLLPFPTAQNRMTLVDTSVWIDHFAAGNADLRDLLGKGQVITHPFVIGELACGSLKNRLRFSPLWASCRLRRRITMK